MKVRSIKEPSPHHIEYESLEYGTIITDSDYPSFGIKELEDISIFVKKGQTSTLPKAYLSKNNLLQLIDDSASLLTQSPK